MRWSRHTRRLGTYTTAVVLTVGTALTGAGVASAANAAADLTGRVPGAAAPDRSDLPLTQYVDPFIGTAVASTSGYAGNINPGAKVPFGMVTFGPDMPRTNFNGSGGYLIGANATSSRINFFSLTHLNGVGCPGQGTVGMMPASTPTPVASANGIPTGVNFQTAGESAAPGYYAVDLDNQVDVALTATNRTGMAEFTYPDAASGYLSLDTRLNGNSNARSGAGNISAANTSLAIAEDGRVLTGKTVAPAFCTPYGTPFNSNVYFYAELDKPLRAQPAGSQVNTVDNGAALLQYDLPDADPRLAMRVGISAVSVANAKLNLETENPDGTFEQIRAAADAQWNDRLNSVQIDRAAHPEALTATQRDALTKFYTALYRVFGSPTTYSDVNGDFRSMHATPPIPTEVDLTGGVPVRPVANVTDYAYTRPDGSTGGYSTHYSGLSMWDTYRSQAQLLAMLAPDVASEVMQSLVVDAQQCGAFPHWVDASDDSTPMAGDNALPVLAGSYAFGARDFDVVAAATFVKQSVFDPQSNCNGHASMPDQQQYLADGYYPDASSANIERYTSDRAAAEFLDAVPPSVRFDPLVDVSRADIDTLYDRATWWRNIFDFSTGTIAARTAPATPGVPGELEPGSFHESTEPNYFWAFAHAWPELITAIGGKDRAVERLNRLFSIDDDLTRVPTAAELNGGQDSQGFYMGNEMGHPAPWAYNWARAPASTQYIVQKLMDIAFTTGRDGLPGNDDMGATSAWYVFAALGMFPVAPADPGLALSTPQFPGITVRLGDAVLRIETSADAVDAPFIQSMRIEHRRYVRSWMPVDRIADGAVLSYALGTAPSSWAERVRPKNHR